MRFVPRMLSSPPANSRADTTARRGASRTAMKVDAYAAIAVVKPPTSVCACMPKRMPCLKPAANASVTERYYIATRKLCHTLSTAALTPAPQLPVPKVHNQDHTNRREGSSIQFKLQSVSTIPTRKPPLTDSSSPQR